MRSKASSMPSSNPSLAGRTRPAAPAVRAQRETGFAFETPAGIVRGRRGETGGERWEATLFWALLAIVFLAPLPLGSDRPLPESLLYVLIGILVLAWGVGMFVGVSRPQRSIRFIWPAIALFGSAAAWAATQALPWTPPSLHHPYWQETGAVLGAPVQGAISADPAATWIRLAALLAHGGVFWLAFQLGSAGKRAGQALQGLSIAGSLYALYGLYVYFSGSEMLWQAHVSYFGRVTSTFVNANSYATYAGMILLCGAGLIAQAFQRQLTARDQSLAAAVLAALSRPNARLAIGILTVILSGSALLLSQSRGGFVATIIALVVFMVTLRRMKRPSGRWGDVGITTALIALVIVVVHVSGERTIDRFGNTEENLAVRMTYYETVWTAAADRPLLGTGLGTFAQVFKAYNHAGTGTYFLDRAHNTYLQLMMELGWPAASALLMALSFVVLRCVQGLQVVRRNEGYLATVVACAVLVSMHALVDFSIEMPANAVTFALLLGVGCALSRSNHEVAGEVRERRHHAPTARSSGGGRV